MHDDRNGRRSWKDELRLDAARIAAERRFGTALIAVGWVHLASFSACQMLVDPRVKSDPRHLALWAADLMGSLAAIRVISGRGWYRSSPAAGLVARIWGTYLILAFNLAMMNGMSGWDRDWFKPPWATLSAFGFAAMAWLFDARLLILAVLMYFTGLLMIAFPGWNYAIFGLSWWAALHGIGASLAIGASRIQVGAAPSRDGEIPEVERQLRRDDRDAEDADA